MDLHDDVPGGPRPDVVASALDLPFKGGSAEKIYAGHVFEHIPLTDLPKAIDELRRVLAREGELVVVGPDVGLTALFEPNLLPAVLEGGGRWPGDAHAWPCSGLAIADLLSDEGFRPELINIADVPDVWPIVDRVPWQFACHAQKR